MSLSDTIDQRYRMLPADLNGRARQVIVRGVAVEGVEFVTPLVYFEGVGRPLALDADQRMEMARIARSTILSDWIGAALVLQPVRERGQDRIRLHALDEAGRVIVASAPATDAQGQNRAGAVLLRTLAVLLMVAFLLTAVWLVENSANLQPLLDVLQP